MKMDCLAVASVIAMMVISTSLLQGARAQDPIVNCFMLPGAGAPWDDANTLVQTLRLAPGQCCQTRSDDTFCTVLGGTGNAAATLCAPVNYCLNCADVGDGLNLVLAQCNYMNEVQGAYLPDGTNEQIYFYLSSPQ